MVSTKPKTYLLFAEAHAVKLTEKHNARGFFPPLSSGTTALNFKAGYVKNGHMTVGVHISVPVTDTDVVISSSQSLFKLLLGCRLHIS